MVEAVVLIGGSILIGLVGVWLGMLLAPRIGRWVEGPNATESGAEAGEERRDGDD